MKTDQYTLAEDGVTPIPSFDIREWAQWMKTADRKLENTKIGDSEVSTVFLATDHNFCDMGAPVLWETLVFGGELDGEMNRYCTAEDARIGHAEMVERVKQGGTP